MDMDDATIGARLRVLRRWRGMSQVELAGLAGLSASFVSMVENGTRMLDRRSHIAAIANALRVSEMDLAGGPRLSADRQRSDPHLAIPPLRMALQTSTLSDPACERARPLDELVRVLDERIGPLFTACDYVRLGEHLPAVIDELHYRVAVPADEAEYRRALRALVEACVYAALRAKDLGYPDLAHLAAARAGEAAAVLDEPVTRGKAAYAWLLTMPRAGSWDRTMRAAERAADSLEGHAGDDPDGIAVLGQLTLTVAMAAAVERDSAAAGHWLDQASRLAGRIPDDPARGWHSFSATNVGVWRVSIGVERGESGGAVLELARQVDESRLAARKSRLAAFRCDVGRGLAREARTRSDAVRWLRQAEDTAPQRIRNSAPVRQTVAYLLERSRAGAGGRELRGMAARMAIPR